MKRLIEKEGGMCQKQCNQTALMYAAKRGHSQCVAPLMGKELCMQSSHGCTALIEAIQATVYTTYKFKVARFYKLKRCISLLWSDECCVSDNKGKTAFNYAEDVLDSYASRRNFRKFFRPLLDQTRDSNSVLGDEASDSTTSILV